jgi:hypothetical protein
MPKVKAEKTTTQSAQETFNKIKHMLESDKDLRKFDPNLACTFNESNMTGTAKGSQFKADMKVTSKGDGSHVEIEVDLPLMLTPVKGMVQSTLQKKLDSVLS